MNPLEVRGLTQGPTVLAMKVGTSSGFYVPQRNLSEVKPALFQSQAQSTNLHCLVKVHLLPVFSGYGRVTTYFTVAINMETRGGFHFANRNVYGFKLLTFQSQS